MAEIKDPENTLFLDLKDGRVTIELRPDLAPKHCARIKELAREGFYDGIVFHRVIDGFMAQSGDPSGSGFGGSGQNIDAEFSSEQHIEGSCSMARSAEENSADSQFFLCFDRAPHLDNQYTFWGQIIDGMEHVHAIKKGSPFDNGSVDEPDSILKMHVAADTE